MIACLAFTLHTIQLAMVILNRFYIISVALKNMSHFFLGCECNLSGTVSGSSACTDNDGDCLCAIEQGYTGTKCDECLEGWWWMSSDRTCMGNHLDQNNCSLSVPLVFRLLL